MDPDELVQCPYDRSHRVRVARVPYHLVKCRRNHPQAALRLASCPFNARHQLPQAELQSHLSSCPDRDQLGLPQDIDLALGRGMKQPEALPAWAGPPCQEDWEAELQDLEEPQPFILQCGLGSLPPLPPVPPVPPTGASRALAAPPGSAGAPEPQDPQRRGLSAGHRREPGRWQQEQGSARLSPGGSSSSSRGAGVPGCAPAAGRVRRALE